MSITKNIIKDEPISESSPPQVQKRFRNKFDTRSLRFSSNPKENSVFEVERQIRENQYLHHKFQPSLQSNQSLKYIKYLNKTRNQQDKQEIDTFLQSIDPNNHSRQEAAKIKFNFDSMEERQFKNEGLRYKSKNLMVTFKNGMTAPESDLTLKNKFRSIENSGSKRQSNGFTQSKELENEMGRLSRVSEVVDKFLKHKFLNKKSSHDCQLKLFRQQLYDKYQTEQEQKNSSVALISNTHSLSTTLQTNQQSRKKLNESSHMHSSMSRFKANESSMATLNPGDEYGSPQRDHIECKLPYISQHMKRRASQLGMKRKSKLFESFDLGRVTVVKNHQQDRGYSKNKDQLHSIIMQCSKQKDLKKDAKNLEFLCEEQELMQDAMIKYKDLMDIRGNQSTLKVREILEDMKEWQKNDKEIIESSIKKYMMDI